MSDLTPRYPASLDNHLQIPLTPAVARLSEAESPEDYGLPKATNQNSHPDLHDATNKAIRNIEWHSIPDDSATSHDHSDPVTTDYSDASYAEHPNRKKGRQLRVQNTHVFTDNSTPNAEQSARADSTAESIHHSVGTADNLGEYQAVSGHLWRRKHMDDVPDNFLLDLDKLTQQWPTDVIQYPGDNLKDIFVQMMHELKAIIDDYNRQIQQLNTKLTESNNKLKDLQDKHASDIAELNRRLHLLEDRVPAGINGKFAIGNLNVLSRNGKYIRTHQGDQDSDLSFS